eukprot:COSAG05_NODE_2877_length_2551_cov_1.807504_2_plen_116_part_00
MPLTEKDGHRSVSFAQCGCCKVSRTESCGLKKLGYLGFAPRERLQIVRRRAEQEPQQQQRLRAQGELHLRVRLQQRPLVVSVIPTYTPRSTITSVMFRFESATEHAVKPQPIQTT